MRDRHVALLKKVLKGLSSRRYHEQEEAGLFLSLIGFPRGREVDLRRRQPEALALLATSYAKFACLPRRAPEISGPRPEELRALGLEPKHIPHYWSSGFEDAPETDRIGRGAEGKIGVWRRPGTRREKERYFYDNVSGRRISR